MQLAYQSPSANNCLADNEVFVRLRLGHEEDFLNLAPSHIPILYREALGDYRHNIVDEHVAAARTLKERGFDRIVIGADEDGAWQKILSPRFSQGELVERSADLRATFEAMAELFDDVWLLLNVEELTPGGMDATDGVMIAQMLEAKGLKNIIATSGSKDFPPLYDRRSTEKKSDQTQDFLSHEPDMAASLWIKQHTGLAVWALMAVNHEASAQALAREIGLAGIIKKAHK